MYSFRTVSGATGIRNCKPYTQTLINVFLNSSLNPKPHSADRIGIRGAQGLISEPDQATLGLYWGVLIYIYIYIYIYMSPNMLGWKGQGWLIRFLAWCARGVFGPHSRSYCS